MSVKRGSILMVLITAFFTLLNQHCRAAEIKPSPNAPAYSFVRVIPNAGERIFVLPIPTSDGVVLPVDIIEAKNGTIAFTGPPGLYAVLWFSTDGQGQAFVRIQPPGPGPNPPGPNPPQPDIPTGWAGEVYKQAKAIGDKEFAGKLAAVFRAVHGKIGTELTTLQAIYTETQRHTTALSTPEAWRPFNDWLSSELTRSVQTVPNARTAYTKIVIGLEAAAR